MKYIVKPTNAFKKAYKKCIKQNLDISLLDDVIQKLASGQTLEPKYRDHALTGIYTGFRECHVKPDWLLIYRINNDILVLTLIDTGSHSEVLKM